MATKHPRIDRRSFLKLSSLALSANLVGTLQGCENNNSRLIGGYKAANGTHGVGAIDFNGHTIWSLPSPARVHGLAIHSALKLGAVAARRPGEFIQIFDPNSGALLHELSCPETMFLEGHVEFSGQQLWVTAAVKGSSQGILLSWNLNQLSAHPQILELPGIGPHQVLRGNNDQLWIAIGGWKTYNREVLNAENFSSTLLAVDTSNGAISNHGNPTEGLSLRHLETYGDEVYAAMQYPNPHPSAQALVYRYKKGAWSALGAPANGWESFKGYIASVAVNSTQIIATSPQGHYLGTWDRANLGSQSNKKVLDVAGAASVENQLKASSGVGLILDSSKPSESIRTAFHWDNHWVGYHSA